MKDNLLEAIVLAGGLGTRLQSVVSDLPKPMADINGRPFLTYIFEWLKEQNVKRIILAVSYKKGSIIDYFGNQWCDIRIDYSFEENPKGTGGAIMQALNLCEGNYVVSCNGDTLFPVDVSAMYSHTLQKKVEMTIACRHVCNANRYGLLELSDGCVTSMNEKQKVSEGFINGGVYLLHRDLLLPWKDIKKFSFETDALPSLISSKKVGALISEAYFIDIGIPEDYARARREL